MRVTDTRLLVASRGEDGGSVVEVAHEALFRSWPSLTQWIQDTADDHRLRRQITQLATYWKDHGHKDEHRWPDDRVVEAVAMLDHLGLEPEDLSEDERGFLGPLDLDRMLAEIVYDRRAVLRCQLCDHLRPVPAPSSKPTMAMQASRSAAKGPAPLMTGIFIPQRLPADRQDRLDREIWVRLHV
jgi:hypothetical protein